jgi:hypothetical protein
MKFGYIFPKATSRLLFPFSPFPASLLEPGGNCLNHGDVIQGIGVRALYRWMGIPEKDIVAIDMDDLPTYQGEEMVLVYCLFSWGDIETAIPFSPNVYPVFFGFTFFPWGIHSRAWKII